MSVRNDSDMALDRTTEYRDLQAETHAENVANEVGASIAAGFRQQIGYGGDLYGISGETELTLNIEASFKRAWETSTTTHREHEMTSETSFEVPPRTHAYFERVEQVGPARQVITASGALAFGCRLHSSGHWVDEWETIQDWVANVQGIETPNGYRWMQFYRAHPIPSSKLEIFRSRPHATVEKIREFEEAHNVQIVVRTEPLS